MVVVGNPPDYLLAFGGVTEEPLDGQLSTYKLKKTINDLWVYHTGTRLWSKQYVNSEYKPQKREQFSLVTVKEDRLVLMYGGSQGQTLYDDVWQYNLNSNMWDQITLSNKRSNLKSDNIKNCTFCDQCERCDFRPDKRVDCLTCWDCYHDEKNEDADVFNDLTCGHCAECDESTFFECKGCTSCFQCFFALGDQKPPGLKGHTMVRG